MSNQTSTQVVYSSSELEEKKHMDLCHIAGEIGIEHPRKYRKPELISKILEIQGQQQPGGSDSSIEGILDIMETNYGFLRTRGYLMGNNDVYVAPPLIRRYNLRAGDKVRGVKAQARSGEKYAGLLEVTRVNDRPPEEADHRPVFESLIPVYPNSRFRLEDRPDNISMRIVDIMSPIGKGQRGLIVSPPKAGKTTILKQLANSIAVNHPDVKLIALLVDERPEEVTDFERSVKGEVVSSTFDEKPDNHTKIADMVLVRAKRLAELGEDVVILLDSLTRLGRAHNLIVPSSGRTLSGGLDPTSLYKPKRFFGAARNIEGGGSVTIIATAIVDTGSRLDEIIYEEFKGTGNMEIHLDRNLSNRRIFPAIDVLKSSTRHEELLFTPDELDRVWKLRRILAAMSPMEALEVLISGLRKTKSNAEFLDSEELRRGVGGAVGSSPF
ncbi:MAG: transcription termination factor Rho [bacterium]